MTEPDPRFSRLKKILDEDITRVVITKGELLILLGWAYARILSLEQLGLMSDNELSKPRKRKKNGS